MRWNHRLGVQVHGIEDLEFPNSGTARISQIAVVRVGCQSAQAIRIDRRVANRVHDLHVPNVVDVQRLL